MDLICPIWYGTYDNKEQIPRILQWGHTFCQRCLMDLRTSNMLSCPTWRSCFSPDVNQLIKNFTILEAKEDVPELKVTFWVKHPSKKARFICEEWKSNVCTNCIVDEHKGHSFSESDGITTEKIAQRKLQVLQKKIDASFAETQMFNEELMDIKDQLEHTQEETIKDINEKLEILYEMLKNKFESLEQDVKQHYKKQNVLMKEAINNLDRRKTGLEKLAAKVTNIISTGAFSNSSKLDRFEEEFIELNRSYSTSFHEFKHCVVSINPQTAGQVFESIGSINNPIVQSNSSNSYQYFNLRRKSVSKAYFFGDSNHQDLILCYDFSKDKWRKKEVPHNLVLQSYSVAIGLSDGTILITGGLNSTFTNVSGSVSLYNPETETWTEKSPLLYNRYTHALAHYGNYVYAIGGRSINGVLESWERYCISMNKWEKIAMLNQRRCTMPAIVYEDMYIYVFGGYEGSGRIDSIEQYDIANDIWLLLKIKFPLSVEAETATLISKNEVLILGGHDNSAGTKDAMIVNLETHKFLKIPPMEHERFLHSAFAYENYAYVIGGVENWVCQRMSINTYKWENITSYESVISNNLQTFSSAWV